MAQLTPTPRTTLKRRPERAAKDRAALDAVLDEGLVCHVAFAGPDGPVVLPTAYVRLDDRIYIHRSTANRMLRALRDGAEASDDMLRDTASAELARYKLPKAFVHVDSIVRAPSGKPDYRWATATAVKAPAD